MVAPVEELDDANVPSAIANHPISSVTKGHCLSYRSLSDVTFFEREEATDSMIRFLRHIPGSFRMRERRYDTSCQDKG